MNRQDHWDRVYQSKRSDEVSWFRPHLETSLSMIRSTGVPRHAPIIDVGGGASTLVDDLTAVGYTNVTVVDLAAAALVEARARLGERASAVTWLASDITRAALPARRFHLWHDRAVFHFLTDPAERDEYLAQVRHALAPGGYIIVATFGPEGPERCSGLPTMRYGAEALHRAFGDEFVMLDRIIEEHQTPAGRSQQFLYCL